MLKAWHSIYAMQIYGNKKAQKLSLNKSLTELSLDFNLSVVKMFYRHDA